MIITAYTEEELYRMPEPIFDYKVHQLAKWESLPVGVVVQKYSTSIDAAWSLFRDQYFSVHKTKTAGGVYIYWGELKHKDGSVTRVFHPLSPARALATLWMLWVQEGKRK